MCVFHCEKKFYFFNLKNKDRDITKQKTKQNKITPT